VSALNSSVLVLNKFYTAIHLVAARKAFCLLVKNVAEVVSVEEGHFAHYDFETWMLESQIREQDGRHPDSEWVRTVSQPIEVPKVVRLVTYDKLPGQSVHFNRRNVFARDDNVCQYCGQRFSQHDLSIDHVLPRAQGGKTVWKNIVTACVDCNKHKGSRTPYEAAMKLLVRPAAPYVSPLIKAKEGTSKYEAWRHFMNNA